MISKRSYTAKCLVGKDGDHTTIVSEDVMLVEFIFPRKQIQPHRMHSRSAFAFIVL